MNSSTWSEAQALAYIASYADLRAVLGANAEAGRRHYAQAGMVEGRTITFDPWSYLASYSDLRAVFGADTTSATRHFIQTGVAEGRTVTFDPWSYLASYSDLRAAFGTDTAAATRHFIERGTAEGRTTTFDALAYLASHPDLAGTFGTDTRAAARHFVEVGAAQGRTITFDAWSYLAGYPDLRAVFGTDTAAATRHFIERGAAEGRTATFDALAYVASHADLIAAFGSDVAAATRHFVRAGAAEGRTITFDPVAYLLGNADLLSAGFDARSALQHWVVAGFREGRSAEGAFGRDQADHALTLSGIVGGTIDRTGDRDWFRIDLDAHEKVTLDLSLAGGQGTIVLYDASGRAVAADEVAGSRTTFTTTTKGAYYAVVAAGANATGGYTLAASPYYTRVAGTAGNDTLAGTSANEHLLGLTGDDVLTGGAGNDLLQGGLGKDRLNGGAGDDILYGDDRDDDTRGDDDEIVDNTGGNDRIYGQAGNDRITVAHSDSRAAAILIDGGSGNDDILYTSAAYQLDTVTILGGSGNDIVQVGAALSATIDAGTGDDFVRTFARYSTIGLGAGSDTVELDNGFPFLGSVTITDFRPGEDRLNIDKMLVSRLTNWDGTTNPFSTGHLLLTEGAGDTVLLIDPDGYTGPQSRIPIIVFKNTGSSSFTAQDLGYAPSGAAAVDATLTGTQAADRLIGANGNDTLLGLAGDDTLDGRSGNDLIEGGAGLDRLEGGTGDDTLYGNNAANTGVDGADSVRDTSGGNDRLFGQDGDDEVYVYRIGGMSGTTALLDGGVGNDRITFDSQRLVDTVTVRGGAGDDIVRVDRAQSATIDAGSGNDLVTIDTSSTTQTITLGEGADILRLGSRTGAFATINTIRVTDFAVGQDTLDLATFLSGALLGWDKATNPFATGHLRLVQSGADTLLQLDRDGSTGTAYTAATLLTLASTTASAFTARDLGYAPIVMTAMPQGDAFF